MIKYNLIDKKFGKLLVIGPSSKRGKDGGLFFWCQCDCGNLACVRSVSLRNNDTKSCGCIRVEKTTKRSTFHGQARKGKISKTYRAWRAMITRCYNSNYPFFHRYGGRGITVCAQWHTFE